MSDCKILQCCCCWRQDYGSCSLSWLGSSDDDGSYHDSYYLTYDHIEDYTTKNWCTNQDDKQNGDSESWLAYFGYNNESEYESYFVKEDEGASYNHDYGAFEDDVDDLERWDNWDWTALYDTIFAY